MSLSTIARPFARYVFGQAVTKGGRTNGQTSGFLYRTEDGRVCVVGRKPVMAAPVFFYFAILLAAWPSYVRGRDQHPESVAGVRRQAEGKAVRWAQLLRALAEIDAVL